MWPLNCHCIAAGGWLKSAEWARLRRVALYIRRRRCRRVTFPRQRQGNEAGQKGAAGKKQHDPNVLPLVAALLHRHGYKRVSEVMRQVNDRDCTNPAGYIIRALKENWTFWEKPVKEDYACGDGMAYITGKYTNYRALLIRQESICSEFRPLQAVLSNRHRAWV